MLNSKQLSLIHVAKSQLGLSDDEYREILRSVCGREIDSSKEIKNLQELRALMTAFEKLGFKPKKVFDSFEKKQGIADSTISPFQIDLIETLWHKVTRNPEDWREALNNFLTRRFFSASVQALSGQKASKVIEALKDMLTKTVLKEISTILYPSGEVVENRLLESYHLIRENFDEEALAYIFSVLIYNDVHFSDRAFQAAQIIESKISHKTITQP